MLYGFCIVKTYRTFQLDLHPRNFPSFEGRYNAYIAVYGQLSGDFLGWFETPLALDITHDDAPELLLRCEQFVATHERVSIW